MFLGLCPKPRTVFLFCFFLWFWRGCCFRRKPLACASKLKTAERLKRLKKSKKQEALLSLLNTNLLSRFFLRKKSKIPSMIFKKKSCFVQKLLVILSYNNFLFTKLLYNILIKKSANIYLLNPFYLFTSLLRIFFNTDWLLI